MPDLCGDIRFDHEDVMSLDISDQSRIEYYWQRIMSKRLNKRQQREAEELELLKAEQDRVAESAPALADEESEEEQEEEEVGGEAPVNAFAAVSSFMI